jgi:PKD repeat protein
MLKFKFLSFFLAFSVVGFSQQSGNWCGTDQILQQLKASNPGFENSMHKSMLKAAANSGAHFGYQKSIITVPVVVHIIHDNGIGNLSEEQIQSALDILNTDYNRLNADTSSTRNTINAPFKPQAGVMNIEFKLAKIDPNGNCTNGIVRVNAPGLTNNANDDCKYTSNGGSDQWPMDKYLNIWVVNSIENDDPSGIILGYAYLPYWPNGANYGILIRSDTFGNIEMATGSDGRTLTHEMGHLLGLQHIFDAGWSGATGCHTNDCAQNGDYCCDTPPQQEPNWSCSQTWNSCPDVPLNDDYGFDAFDQIENYMSYNYCQNMFSRDQVAIMQQNFIDISFMSSWITAQNNIETGVNDPDVLCKADFEASKTVICGGDSLQLIDRSFQSPTNWNWTISPGIANIDWAFVNGTTAISQDPTIQFFTQGVYQVSLEATDGNLSDTETKTQFITVLPAAQTIPFWEGFENITTFANSQNWVVFNPGGNNGFEIDQQVGHTGSHSAKLMNFGEISANSDELIFSPVDLSVVNPLTETVTLSFRYAYRKRFSATDEWLKVFITKNCGDNWIQRKSLHGVTLSTEVFPTSWTPSNQSDWVTAHMTNITSDFFVDNFRFKFEFEGNNGNNFFLDDINIYKGSPSNTIVLGLAEVGEIEELAVFPNPAEEELNLRFAIGEAQDVIIQIQAVSGKIAQTHQINAQIGSNLVMMGTKELAAGMYMLSVKIGPVQKTVQFIKK